jgi:pimeloyl-ACP methyl ester carboxylesterase
MKTIFCISGLGADEKAFAKLTIDGYNLQVINWINPLENETLAQYANRMLQHISESNPILMGLSFGGMLCAEIAKQITVQKIILVSTIKTKHELPFWMKLVGKTKINKLYSMKSYKLTEPLQNLFLGTTNNEEKLMARNSRKQANRAYIKWSVNEIMNWQNEFVHQNVLHIHGDADKIFSIKKINANVVIKNGKHLMIMNRADEVSAAINTFLQS